MRILNMKHILFVVFFLALPASKSSAQNAEINIEQDEKFTSLLNEKRKINSSITINDRYKIQIFYGENAKARKTLAEFKKEFPDMDATIVFESPTYKVWAGSFNTRIDAERMLVKIKEKHPYSLLIKPNK
ncbi:SPOR domain-containing protein [Flavobacterium arcticum]|uniref:SPOR domain-containing protein n=1 Tax=Flavobacterium arcticum TaxID=1784713 RepID=A0A345H9Z8_9FLAO|nr:SPOR domain-containing protein [Flavobacterium arcticum]AXG73408.1 SPOR domain-containing protein [Flavobacterium arcticum]KAF2513195.1 SPOR domain-containing protein [Flavobacterium arcticum]